MTVSLGPTIENTSTQCSDTLCDDTECTNACIPMKLTVTTSSLRNDLSTLCMHKQCAADAVKARPGGD